MKTAEEWAKDEMFRNLKYRPETIANFIREVQSDARKPLIEAFRMKPNFTQDGQQRACHTYTMDGAKWAHWLNEVWGKAEHEPKWPTTALNHPLTKASDV